METPLQTCTDDLEDDLENDLNLVYKHPLIKVGWTIVQSAEAGPSEPYLQTAQEFADPANEFYLVPRSQYKSGHQRIICVRVARS